jgi:Flp pilus assembly protein TadG
VTARGQRGSASVELALGLPLLLVVVLGGVHLGRVVMARHQLADAASFAARAAAITARPDSSRIRAAIRDRLGAGSACSAVAVTSRAERDELGVERLEVTARCAVATGIGGALLGALGPGELVVRVVQPL